jgi:hypothetical protein
MSKLSEHAWTAAFKIAAAGDWAVAHAKDIGIMFSAVAIGWCGESLVQRQYGLSSLEIQLQAQGKTATVAKCLTDATARRYPWTTSIFQRDVAEQIIEDGQRLAASDSVAECKPR